MGSPARDCHTNALLAMRVAPFHAYHASLALLVCLIVFGDMPAPFKVDPRCFQTCWGGSRGLASQKAEPAGSSIWTRGTVFALVSDLGASPIVLLSPVRIDFTLPVARVAIVLLVRRPSHCGDRRLSSHSEEAIVRLVRYNHSRFWPRGLSGGGRRRRGSLRAQWMHSGECLMRITFAYGGTHDAMCTRCAAS